MDIDVYCDEAYPDLFSSQNPQAKYLVIGSLWLRYQDRKPFKAAIHTLRDQYRIGGEFKWTKVTPSRLAFYRNLTDWFWDQGDNLRFRCILVDRTQVNLLKYHKSDQELGFYKFYYQMLHHWIDDFSTYHIFCDYKNNRRRDRLHVLASCLGHSNLSSTIKAVQALRSKESVLMQLADVLVGLTAAKINKRIVHDSAKHQLMIAFEKKCKRKIIPTALSEKKFNVFRINLQGVW